jgi:hypothetical protein
MSSIVENVVMEEVVVVEKKPKAKSFAQKDKKTMYSIMGFLLNLKEQGVLDDEKVMECLEALPLYKTAAEKTAFFQLEMFDTKKVEDELYKPMVLEHKKAKKEKKQVDKEKKPRVKKVAVEGEDVKQKKPRVKKVAVEKEVQETVAVEKEVKETVAVEKEVQETVAVEKEVKEKKPRAKKVAVEGEPKRGRKPKEQIVELAQEEKSNVHSVEEESLDVLIQAMNQKEEPVHLEEIQVEDIDDILRELEAEEIVEPVPVPVKEKKKVKNPEDKPVKKTKKSSTVE